MERHYGRPTLRALPALHAVLRGTWAVPFPTDPAEQASFGAFLHRHGVKVVDGEADRDLCPLVWAWRLKRREVVLTALGRAQYGATLAGITWT